MKKIYFSFILLLQFLGFSQNVIILDANLKNALVNNLCVDNDNDSIGEQDVDTNNDGEIQISEAEAVINLLLSSHSISSMAGVESFTNIEKLVCSYNLLTNLELTSLSKLKYLYCANNQLKQLNIQNISSLKEIKCDNNQLNEINLDGLSNLRYFTISNNIFSTIDFSPLISLTYLNCSHNPLVSININGLNFLQHLYIGNTLITTIDCSQSGVIQLFCSDNPNLTSINIKNNHYSYSDYDGLYFAFEFKNLPLLSSICADLNEVKTIFGSDYNENITTVYSGEDCSLVIPYSPPMKVKDFNSKQNFYLYPNPVQNVLTIEMKNLVAISSVRVFNTVGQLVKNITKPALSSTIEISVSDLKTGTYIVEVDSDSGKMSKKLIKI